MDFETFFIKKKIDLLKLKEASPQLFDELKSSFEQMGAKSFDHSQKFKFNNWRKEYLLIQAPQTVEATKSEEPKSKPYQPLFNKKSPPETT
jgi:hypothetical protein